MLDDAICGHAGRSGGGRLGIYAKSHPALDSARFFPAEDGSLINPCTGEIFPKTDTTAAGDLVIVRDPVSVRLERYALQSVVRSILPDSRTAKCLRVPFLPGGEVEVWYSPEHRSASFGGLVTCGSVWACPVCAPKISERRRLEVQAAIAAWQALGGVVVLLTLTHGHGRGDALADLLQGEQKAIMRFFSCRQGVDLMDALGRIGHIRSWEVTHGRARRVNHGWHPHFHILLFLDSVPADLVAAEDRAYLVWENACRLAGLPSPNRRHGVTLQDGSRAAAYVAKMGREESRWGLGHEMTKGHLKRAKDGETPFDFLRAALAGDDPRARALFAEFAAAFRGKRQLVWSRGLRERFDIAEVSDEEITRSQENDAWILSRLSRDDWRLVLKFDVRGELLELARYGVWDPVARFLDSLRMSK